ncbi:hypothetical protein BV25DRAFT_1922626 [Artomyces pyxidatus]|uniref:Uncharacterized protein n=1 Tax=Artomyces pyxidatus TaxID=48021 RepID=A0ACB8SF05_9AGAM|nr:hypothetical protein BV25DRAFT_1922626 [Artomyces pyxidatus]
MKKEVGVQVCEVGGKEPSPTITLLDTDAEMQSTPLNKQGFHSRFIQDTAERIALRNHLETVICQAVTALDHSCGVASLLVHLHGESDSNFHSIPVSQELLSHHVIISISETLQRDTAFPPVMAEIKERVYMRIAPMFLRDWSIRGTASGLIYPAEPEQLEPVRGVERLSPHPRSLPQPVLDFLAQLGCSVDVLELIRDIIDDVGLSKYENSLMDIGFEQPIAHTLSRLMASR